MILLCVPLKKEWHYLFELFVSSGWSFKKTQVQGFWFWFFHEKKVVVIQGGCGEELSEKRTDFALCCLKNPQSAFSRKSPALKNIGKVKAVFCLGSAGSLSQKLNPGDLVCGTRIIDYSLDQFCLDPKGAIFPFFESYEPPMKIIKALRLKAKDHPIHFGPVVSFQKEVVKTDQRNQIFKTTGGLVVAREGAGSVKASQAHDLPLIEIRAITDRASEESYLEFQKNLKQSMENLGVSDNGSF